MLHSENMKEKKVGRGGKIVPLNVFLNLTADGPPPRCYASRILKQCLFGASDRSPCVFLGASQISGGVYIHISSGVVLFPCGSGRSICTHLQSTEYPPLPRYLLQSCLVIYLPAHRMPLRQKGRRVWGEWGDG